MPLLFDFNAMFPAVLFTEIMTYTPNTTLDTYFKTLTQRW